MTTYPALPTTTRPVSAPAAITRPTGGILRLLRLLARRLRTQASLGRLSDRELQDIGLTRGDIDALRCEPLSADVSTRLATRACSRAGNW